MATATLNPRRGRKTTQLSPRQQFQNHKEQERAAEDRAIADVADNWQTHRFTDRPYRLPGSEISLGPQFLAAIEDETFSLSLRGEVLSELRLEEAFVKAARSEGWGSWKDGKPDNEINDVYLLATEKGDLSAKLAEIVADNQDNISWYNGQPKIEAMAVEKFSLDDKQVKELEKELKKKAAPISCKSDTKPKAVEATKVKIDEVGRGSEGRLWVDGDEATKAGLPQTREEEIAALNAELAVRQIDEIASHLHASQFMVQSVPTFFQDPENPRGQGEVVTSLAVVDTRYPAKMLRKLIAGSDLDAQALYDRADRLGIEIQQTRGGGLSIHIPHADRNLPGFQHTVHLSTTTKGERFLSTNASSLNRLTATRCPLLSSSEGARRDSQKGLSANARVADCRRRCDNDNWGRKRMPWLAPEHCPLYP